MQLNLLYRNLIGVDFLNKTQKKEKSQKKKLLIELID